MRIKILAAALAASEALAVPMQVAAGPSQAAIDTCARASALMTQTLTGADEQNVVPWEEKATGKELAKDPTWNSMLHAAYRLRQKGLTPKEIGQKLGDNCVAGAKS